jgi:hypothetical protein
VSLMVEIVVRSCNASFVKPHVMHSLGSVNIS